MKRILGAIRKTLRRALTWPTLVLTLVLVIYNLVWDYIELARFFSLHALVFDSGTFISTSYSLYPGNWNPAYALPIFSSILQLPFQTLLSPISLLPGYYGFETYYVLQSLFVSLAIIPLYKYVLRRSGNQVLALLLACAYLVYFPLWGANWEALYSIVAFVPLFFAGVYLFDTARYGAAFGFLLASALIAYPSALFAALFAFVVLVEAYHHRKANNTAPKLIWFGSLLLVASLSILISQYWIQIVTAHWVTTALHLERTGYGILYDGQAKLETTLLYFAPLGGLSFLSRRFVILFLPGLAFMWYTSLPAMIFPYTFPVVYPIITAPFVYLAACDTLATWWGKQNRDINNRYANRISRRPAIVTARSLVGTPHGALTLGVVTSLVISGLLFLPYSPLVSLSDQQWYGPGSQVNPTDYSLQINPQYFSEYTSVNDSLLPFIMDLPQLVPRSNPYVLAQADIPQVYPRLYPIFNAPLVSEFNTANLTVADARNNTFPISATGTIMSVPVDYVVANVNSPYFYYGGPLEPGWLPTSMVSLESVVGKSGSYGIVSEDSGFLVLERGYHGAVAPYAPIARSLSPTSTYYDVYSATGVLLAYRQYTSIFPLSCSLCTRIAITSDGSTFFSLVPGSYALHVTAQLVPNTESNIAANASVSVRILSDQGTEPPILNWTKVTPSLRGPGNGTINQTLAVNVPLSDDLGFATLEIAGYNLNANLEVTSTVMVQLSPPSNG